MQHKFLRRFSKSPKPAYEEFQSRIAVGPNFNEFAQLNTEPILPGHAGRTPSKPNRFPKKKSERKPTWLKAPAPQSEKYRSLKSTVKNLNLATVCEEARCPNIGECWGGKEGTATATIMLMGDTCTRACRFCSVKTAKTPPPLDLQEPQRVANAIVELGLDYVVLTCVDRDDLEDGGSNHLAECVRAIKSLEGAPWVEVLGSDFQGDLACVETLANSGLEVYAHNVETVERTTPNVRDRRANYRQSLSVLQNAKKINPKLVTKSSIMLGCGETVEETIQTMRDLRDHGVDIVTLGQYLQPSARQMKVQEYVHPDIFKQLQEEGEKMGFMFVASGPLVRSSYKAGEYFLTHYLENRPDK